MSIEKSGFLILGVTDNGHKFRPSDWIERIATVFASFDVQQRLRYNPMVTPVRHNEQQCLFLDKNLEGIEPAGYKFVMDFAYSNHLQIVDLNPAPVELQFVA
jgi:hypothetical protein